MDLFARQNGFPASLLSVPFVPVVLLILPTSLLISSWNKKESEVASVNSGSVLDDSSSFLSCSHSSAIINPLMVCDLGKWVGSGEKLLGVGSVLMEETLLFLWSN